MKEAAAKTIIEKKMPHISGAAGIVLIILSLALPITLAVASPAFLAVWPLFFIAYIILFGGFVVIRPNEAAVFTFFGKYVGTLRQNGFYYVNPLASAAHPNPAAPLATLTREHNETIVTMPRGRCRLSLKTMTLQNNKQKINDGLGNPIEVGIVVIWRVVDTAKAVFAVDDYMNFLSIQSDSALRRIVSMYPYDVPSEDKAEKSLRGANQTISDDIRKELQTKVDLAGIEIIDAKITHLAYAPEIALAMLQRQQAAAVIDARKLIVEGAVGMVEMAIKKLEKTGVVNLGEEQKARMVGNLLVVLCGNKDALPTIGAER